MNKDINTTAWSAQDVWAAAYLANRVNGGYYKVSEYNQDGQLVKMQNRSLMLKALEDVTQIPADDYQGGEQARTYIKNRCLLKTLKGTARDFDVAVARASDSEYFDQSDRYALALIASQITSYLSGVREEHILSQANRSAGYLAPVGDKVEVNAVPYRVIWSNNYGTYFVSALTDSKQLIFFNCKNRMVVGGNYQIRGQVKSHQDDVTRLSRVRMVDK